MTKPKFKVSHTLVILFSMVVLARCARRDELPNGEIFYTLREAQVLIEQWRVHYNTIQPHSALVYRPPAPEIIVPGDELPMNH